MQALKRTMPVGIEDFKKLVTDNYYFIDKTRFTIKSGVIRA